MFTDAAWDTVRESRPMAFAVMAVLLACAYAGIAAATPAPTQPTLVPPGATAQTGLPGLTAPLALDTGILRRSW